MFILITYDVVNDKRRRKVDKILSGYGDRVNYSVFEIITTKNELKKIVHNLKDVICEKEDNVRVYILNKDVIKNSFVLNKKTKMVFDSEELYF